VYIAFFLSLAKVAKNENAIGALFPNQTVEVQVIYFIKYLF
jgi:hypothetical protein